MKKLILISIYFILTLSSSLAQSVFEDAKVLSKYVVNGEINPDAPRTLQESNLRKIESKLILQSENESNPKKLKELADSINIIATQLKIIIGPRVDTLASLRKYNLADADGNPIPIAVASNPFLAPIVFHGSTQSSSGGKLLKSAASALGGLDVTNIANAVADIMIEHAKQELTVAFFDRFKKFAEQNPEFEILFPKTTENLSNLLSYKYPEMLAALRSGFLEDIRQITFRLDDVLDLPRYQELFKNLPEVTIAIRSLRLVHELETGASNPADVIKQFASFTEWSNNKPRIKNVGSIIKISAFLSESIRSSLANEVWVPAKELRKLFYSGDPTLITVYLGLLYQKALAENIVYVKADGVTSIALTDLLSKHKADILTIRNKMKEFVDLTERVNGAFAIAQKKKEDGTVSNEDYYSYINTALDVVEYGFSLAELFGENSKQAEPYLSILRQSNDLFRNIYTKEYNQAVANTLEILNKVRDLGEESKSLMTNGSIKVVDAKSLISAATGTITLEGTLKIVKSGNVYDLQKDGNTLRSFESLERTIVENTSVFYVTGEETKETSLDKLLVFVDNIKPYALFIANMIEAENEEDIKNAIENAILPVGSSSIKKFSVSNISVQSYLGPRFNLNSGASGKTTWNNSLGVTAPIGIAFSWGGTGKVWKDPASFTLFLALIDLAAIVDYKLTEDDNGEPSQDYKVKLGQIFAPGGYVVWGMPGKIPLSLGLGAQYGPGLLKGNNGIEAVDPDWNFRIFLAVDIPFFTLHNKPRNNLPK